MMQTLSVCCKSEQNEAVCFLWLTDLIRFLLGFLNTWVNTQIKIHPSIIYDAYPFEGHGGGPIPADMGERRDPPWTGS